jgi:hypothetical protein
MPPLILSAAGRSITVGGPNYLNRLIFSAELAGAHFSTASGFVFVAGGGGEFLRLGRHPARSPIAATEFCVHFGG